jgi:hypothetical protein
MYTIYITDNQDEASAVTEIEKYVKNLKENFIKKKVTTKADIAALQGKYGTQLPKKYPIVIYGEMLIGGLAEMKIWYKSKRSKK